MKVCPSCKNSDVVFNISKSNKDGFRSLCIDCEKAKSVLWRRQNIEKCRAYDKGRKEKKREHNYRKKYGISIDVYESMLKDQNGSCMICRQKESRDKKLDIDHCHRTGKIRALLCARCNKTIGLIKDDHKLALSIADYLEKFEYKMECKNGES